MKKMIVLLMVGIALMGCSMGLGTDGSSVYVESVEIQYDGTVYSSETVILPVEITWNDGVVENKATSVNAPDILPGTSTARYEVDGVVDSVEVNFTVSVEFRKVPSEIEMSSSFAPEIVVEPAIDYTISQENGNFALDTYNIDGKISTHDAGTNKLVVILDNGEVFYSDEINVIDDYCYVESFDIAASSTSVYEDEIVDFTISDITNSNATNQDIEDFEIVNAPDWVTVNGLSISFDESYLNTDVPDASVDIEIRHKYDYDNFNHTATVSITVTDISQK